MPLNHSSRFAELTDDQFKLIGRVVVEWANIEFLQKCILSRLLLSPDFISRTYTDLLNAHRMQDAIKEAVDLHRYRYASQVVNEETLTEIERVSREIQKARTHRNKFAHFCWARSSDEEIFGTSFSAGLPDSKKHQKSHLVLKIEALDELYKESYDLVNSLIDIIEKLPKVDEEDLVRKIKAERGIQASRADMGVKHA